MVGVHADLCWQIERYGEAGLAFAEEIAVALVRLDGGAESGVLAHGPEPAAVHGWVDAARVGEFAGVADSSFRIRAREIVLRVQAVDGKAGKSCELLFQSGEGLGFCVGHFGADVSNQLRIEKQERARLGVPQRNRLQLAGAAERT